MTTNTTCGAALTVIGEGNAHFALHEFTCDTLRFFRRNIQPSRMLLENLTQDLLKKRPQPSGNVWPLQICMLQRHIPVIF